MLVVKDLLSKRNQETISVHPDTKAHEALRKMAVHDIGALLVMEDQELRGIFSERDYARKVALTGRNERNNTVGDVMVKHLISVTPENGVKECMRMMTEHRVRHLPVFSDEKIVGIVTIGDVVKDVIEEQKSTISHLETYICGGYLS